MAEVGVRAYTGRELRMEIVPLALDEDGRAALRLRSLPGATALHLEITESDEVVQRLEVDVDGEEVVPVHLQRWAEGTWDAQSHGRGVLSLLANRRYEPLTAIRAVADPPVVDLLFLVDGTARIYEEPSANSTGSGPGDQAVARFVPLIGREAWRQQVDHLVELADAVGATAGSLRVAVMAFGDQEAEALRARSLRPRYHLYPEAGGEVRLNALDSTRLRNEFLAIPATSGGDFVDALGDALDRCAALRWRDDASRFVILTGDSPGYSIVHPAPLGADLLAREKDVETTVAALHGAGVQIATIFHRPPPESGYTSLVSSKVLVHHTAEQYRRIASRPDLALELAAFEPEVLARRILAAPPLTGRGPAYGVIEEDQ